MMITLLILTSLLTAFVPFLSSRPERITSHALVTSTIVLGLGLFVGIPPLLGSSPVAWAGLWYVDAFSGLLVVLISIVQWTATLTSQPFLREEVREDIVSLPLVRRYYALLALFVTAMFATVVSDNLGFLWVALEATTLATTFLVAFYARASALEAAWKYLILCSTGLALGFVALLLVLAAQAHTGVAAALTSLEWSTLSVAAVGFSPVMMKVAFAFALVGFGTKVGLAPLHTWLPDAHSSAPAPISALLSGVLLNAALFAVLRYKSLTDAALGSSTYTDGLLLAFGAFTLIVAAAFILTQTDYKRLLAYSSMEHMGFMVLALGLGAVGTVAAIVELIGHALIKPMLFFGAGNILLRFRSTKFARVAGVRRVLPISGAFFFAGILMLLAVPPSPLFLSEYLTIAAGITTHPFVIALALVALVVILTGFIRLVAPFLFAPVPEGDVAHPVVRGESWNLSHTAMLLHLALAVGFFALILSGAALPFIERITATIS